MTALRHAALRHLALKVLAQHAGSAAGSGALATAARRAYEDLALVSTPLIGQAGVSALTGRALHLTQRDYPWLGGRRDPAPAYEPFDQVIARLEQQDPAVAAEGAAAVFATFAGLLVTFIGEPVTTRLLQKAWPVAFAEATNEER
jgi:hypothetical protein